MEQSLGLRPQAALPQPSPDPGHPFGANSEKVIDLARVREARWARKTRNQVADAPLPLGVGDHSA